MIDWKRKLTSRKFWACLADFISMVLIAVHVADSTASQVAAIVMAGGGVIAYIIGEGLADAANKEVEMIEYMNMDEDEPKE